MTGSGYSERFRRACHRAAYVMYDMWSELGYSDSRLLLPPLIPDHLVTVGESFDGAETKEHVIPRKVLMDQCHRIFREGGDASEAERLILEHLRIVWISKREAAILNKREHLNLRQTMPEGWTFELGDEYARLAKAGIEFAFYGGSLDTAQLP